MKSILKKIFSVILAAAAVISAVPVFASAASVSFDRIVNASTHIIITNEGNYSTVVRNDNGALSIGQIGWHATNALNLLKDIVAENPSQALNILGATLYNEIITSVNWENRIATTAEASVLKILLSTSESKKVQDETAYEYISSYVRHGQSLGITEPESLVFFADYQNQNGYTGAENFFYRILEKHTYNTDGNHGNQNVYHVFGFGVHLKFEEPTENPVDFFPENNQCTQDGSYVYYDGECQVVFPFYSKQGRPDSQVTTTAHRKVFRQSLQNTQYQCFKPAHFYFLLSFYYVISLLCL